MSIYVKTSPSGIVLDSSRRGYVGLSLSNKITSSEHLLTKIFEWARGNLAFFDVLIGDSVYRHNLEDLAGLNPGAAIDRALLEGREAAQRVQRVLDRQGLSAPRIRLVSEFYGHPLFAGYLAAKRELYDADPHFRRQIGVASDGFFQRFAPDKAHDATSRAHSRDYQLEELAVFELLADEGYSVNVYPGAHLPVMKDLVDGPLVGVMPKLRDLILVELRFRSVS